MMASMNRLPFFCSTPACQQGFSLAELCVVLGLLAITTGWAAPALQHWLWRLRVEAVVQAWMGDLQTARLQALRQGQALQLQRLGACANLTPSQGDWRCGWELRSQAKPASPALLTQALAGEVSVQLNPPQDWLLINAQGETVAGGLRVVVQGKGAAPVVRSICINITGRMRVVSAVNCT